MLHRLPLIVASLTAKMPDGRAALALGPIQFAASSRDDEPTSFTLLGYRQTEKPACKGGRCANSNFFRFRHKRMRAIARTFKGQPFLTGHDWGDVRARGGTIRDAWAEAPHDAVDELAFFASVLASEQWAIEGLANGTIDRFSIGAVGRGEITCTVHGTPVWTDCFCWPGYRATGEDGEELLVEWEYEDAQGVEISAVNVPAVDGTGITEAEATEVEPSAPPIAAALEQLGELCGHAPDLAAIAELARGSRPVAVQVAAAAPIEHETERVAAASGASADDVAAVAAAMQTLGLTREETARACDALSLVAAASSPPIAAEVAALRAQLDAANRELERHHHETAIERLRATHQVADAAIDRLRSFAVTAGRAAFDAAVALVAETAPRALALGAAPFQRATLQSDAPPAAAPGAQGAALELDAYEQHKSNPHLPRMMKLAGLSVEDVRKHGAVKFAVVPNLRELAEATERRGG